MPPNIKTTIFLRHNLVYNKLFGQSLSSEFESKRNFLKQKKSGLLIKYYLWNMNLISEKILNEKST